MRAASTASVEDSRKRQAPALLALLDRPWRLGALAGLAAALELLLRVVVVGKGNPGTLVLLGSRFASPGYRAAVPVHPGNGYDGQFYYRFALGPFEFARTWSGITLDGFGRFNRISYSVLAWILAGGQHSLVPWSLLAVNVLGLAALGWLGAALARSCSHNVLWGLIIPAFPGFLWSLGRDLTEIVESAFLVGALLALRRCHPVLAGALLVGAVLGRETAMGLVGVLAIVDVAGRAPPLASWLRRHGRLLDENGPGLTWAWVVPALAFTGWQLLVKIETGSVPLLDSGRANLGLPFVGFVHAVGHYLASFGHRSSLLWFGCLFVLVVVVALGARALVGSSAPGYERLAWGLFLVVSLCLSQVIWDGNVGFRSLDDVYVMSCVLLLTSDWLGSSRATRLLPVLSTGAWLVAAAALVKDL